MMPVSTSTREHKAGLAALLRHTSLYSIGTLLITLASIISFPIFTRIFSVAEYGIFGLVNVTLGFLVGVGKLGLQKSIVRYHAEIDSGQRNGNRVEFFSTVVFGMVGVGFLMTTFSAFFVLFSPTQWWGSASVQHLIVLASPLVFIRVIDSAMLNLLNAEQKSALYSTFTVLRKYLGLGFILAVMFFITRSLHGFYIASIIAEGLALAFIVQYYAKQGVFRWHEFSPSLFRSMLLFGAPLLVSELSTILLAMGGRYVINYQLGPHPLGTFSAAYNFSDYIQSIIVNAFAAAIVPMYLRMWEEKGKEATVELLRQGLRYYIVVALPIVAGMAAVGPGLLAFLASDKYQASALLLFFILSGMMIAGGTPIFSAGIYIAKLTKVVMYTVLGVAAVNIGLTLLLLPHLGIEGAALAALASYLLYSGSTAYFGRHCVRVPVPWLDLAKFGLMSVAMYFAVREISLSSKILTLVAQIGAGVVVYAVLVLSFDRPLRAVALKVLSRLD